MEHGREITNTKVKEEVNIEGVVKKTELNLGTFETTEGNSEKSLHCEKCGKEFKSRGKLNLHIKTIHNKLTPFKCGSCDKGFPEKYRLKNHISNIHDKIKLHQCYMCNKMYGET